MSSLLSTSILPSHLHLSSLKLLHISLRRPPKGKTRRYKPNACSMDVNVVHKGKKAAAFFDVDGTITRTNIVAAYFHSRVREIPMTVRFFWVPWFAVSCMVFLLVDRIDRTAFNHLFYLTSFKSRSTVDKKDMARTIYQDYYRPRIFRGAVEKIKHLKKQGYHIVLVTGSLDFLIAPLARELGADFVYASQLVEKGGRFTGQVSGTGASSSSKAECVLSYAKVHELCLSNSLAFGDCIADLCMLESVGVPHAVNPDGQLKNIAASRGWPIIHWKLEDGNTALNLTHISSIFSKPQISKARETTHV